ncbi:MAG: aminopeptidase [Desulfuromonadales bacterium]|nr:aminopeptidase [Desulfuromonadales bacterium]
MKCVAGHLDVMARTRPIAEVLKDPQVPEAERKQLVKVLAIRSFAVDELGLPDNDSYRLYADVGRPYVVWNVVATPELSMAPKQWCYPVVGCVAYRGYFDPDAAKAMGEELAAQGFDVDVYGVKAYSTLSWFDDPVLNTFLDGADSQLAALIFHELAHQVVYVADDCAFNEAFAKTVEMEGLRRWLQVNATGDEWQGYLERELRSTEFLDTLSKARDQLVGLYAQPLSDADKRSAKRETLARLEGELRSYRDHWPNPAALDGWLERGLNNARLASNATYRERVPAFQALLNARQGNLPAFYAEVGQLAKLPATERIARLKEYGELEVAAVCTEEKAVPHQ